MTRTRISRPFRSGRDLFLKSFAAALALAALGACGGGREGSPAGNGAAELKQIADDYLKATLALSPFAVVYAGVGDVVKEDHAAMEDNSPAGLARFQRAEDALADRFAAIDAAAKYVADIFKKAGLEPAFHGSYLQPFQVTIGAVLGSLAELVRNSYPRDHWSTYAERVRALTPADLDAAAKAVVRPNQAVWIVVGDRAKIEAGVREAGIGEVIVIDADGRPAAGN